MGSPPLQVSTLLHEHEVTHGYQIQSEYFVNSINDLTCKPCKSLCLDDILQIIQRMGEGPTGQYPELYRPLPGGSLSQWSVGYGPISECLTNKRIS